MKKTYECMLLLDNREVKKGWEELKTTVNGLFSKHGAEVVSARRWDERRLTFPIKRQQRATYLLMYFNADAPQVQAIRRDMEFSDPVLRNFVIGCEKIPEAAFEVDREDAQPVVTASSDDTMTVSTAAHGRGKRRPGARMRRLLIDLSFLHGLRSRGERRSICDPRFIVKVR